MPNTLPLGVDVGVEVGVDVGVGVGVDVGVEVGVGVGVEVEQVTVSTALADPLPPRELVKLAVLLYAPQLFAVV
jgi:hypothetical protein